MNRKGDIAIVLLPIVTIVLAGLALFAFLSYNGEVDGDSRELAEMLTEVEFSEKYVHELAVLVARESIVEGLEFKEVALRRDLNLENMGNFIGKIRNDDFSFVEEGDKWVLEIEGLFVKSVFEGGSMERNFDLKMEFDLSGKLVDN